MISVVFFFWTRYESDDSYAGTFEIKSHLRITSLKFFWHNSYVTMITFVVTSGASVAEEEAFGKTSTPPFPQLSGKSLPVMCNAILSTVAPF